MKRVNLSFAYGLSVLGLTVVVGAGCSGSSYFLQQDWIRGVTIWGWIVGKTWIANSGLVRSDGTARPAMTWLMTTLNRPQP